jgi:hypothetical protein
LSIVDSSQDGLRSTSIARLSRFLVFAAAHSGTVPRDVEALSNLPHGGSLTPFAIAGMRSLVTPWMAPRIVAAIEILRASFTRMLSLKARRWEGGTQEEIRCLYPAFLALVASPNGGD